MIWLMFRPGFRDAQCGFKAMTRPAARTILPHVQNLNWFFDTEMLLIGAKNGFKVYELPVQWAEDPGTTVRVMKTASENVKGLMRLPFHMPRVHQSQASP